MKRVLVLAPALLCGCLTNGSNGPVDCSDPFQAFAADLGTFGAACYKHPADEGEEGTGVKAGIANLCALATGDDPCVACEKASCCETGAACVSDATCLCLVGCQAGATLATCEAAAQCDAAPDEAYTAAAACSAKLCAAACRTLATP
jgi:hypothetical protein